ncbi:MAG: M42 family metallopeptidase [Candidatus Marinimicrobia bacterium]|nr:M42 family metallopeptidase [Candidatus Neomarinimicrobiota bacterium]MBL7046146.1 M42 family metallopeptidase [Candidatus Neomarinimicrobiota bacterium]
MKKSSMNFLETMMKTPSPSGYEHKLRKVWSEEMKKYSDEVKIDVHGNIVASINPDKRPRIMLAGHMDELGFQVEYINDKGFIYFNHLGGFDIAIIPGRKVRIHTKQGDILGVTGKKAIHLFEKKDREKVPKRHELYIDIGANDKKEVQKYVEIGDPITYDFNIEELRNGLYISRGFDDKIGAFIVAEVLKNVYRKKSELNAALFSVATCQEEVGLRGARTSAYGIDPQIGVAIDVTHGTDTPDVDVKKVGEIKLSEGAAISRGPNINPKVFEILLSVAKKKKIKYQVEAAPRPTGTDANVIQITRAGVATGLVSIPCRYMHTYTELISMKDVESAINILTEFCLSVDEKTDFTP